MFIYVHNLTVSGQLKLAHDTKIDKEIQIWNTKYENM
jgi:hypothetical protein